MNCNTTHYRANSSSVPGDPTSATGLAGSDQLGPPAIWPIIGRVSSDPWYRDKDLLELKWYDGKAPTIYLVRSKCLPLLAYGDYFPDNPGWGRGLRSMVSRAILGATPGWCGTFGPGVDGAPSVAAKDRTEGNYDMTQMFLLPIAYRHYDDITPAAREYLITQLLACGRIHRPRKDDTFTSGSNPNDWSRAGFISPLAEHIDIGETENHILMIVTARYLTNQLMYQRKPLTKYDNLRNGGDDYPSCTALLLTLLRRIIRGDFSEYNAKPYQSETRWALLNLCTYAYDHAVRLGARMVLDYLSAHMAVSSNDLRRLLPFRRINIDENTPHTAQGYMTVGIVDVHQGADPMARYFAMQAGNLRAYQRPELGRGPFPCRIEDGGVDMAIEVLSAYRLPRSIHDLFVNDLNRRFFQRLHRTIRHEVGGNRNCDNMEIYAASPSYLITAGGEPATWAIDPDIASVLDGDTESKQRGVAVTTSFMATGDQGKTASELIQFGEFSSKSVYWFKWKFFGYEVKETNIAVLKSVANYGVAPDFACGHQVWLPQWVNAENSQNIDGTPVDPHVSPGFSFVNMGTIGSKRRKPGFFLAIYQQTPGGMSLLEAYDTWRNAELTFDQFREGVHRRNAGLQLISNTPAQYVTSALDRIEFTIWKDNDGKRGSESGAEVSTVVYEDPRSIDALGHADKKTSQLVNGTVMNSPGDAIVVINNPMRRSTVTLDFSDEARPTRFDSETGEFEAAGPGSEVWVDFGYSGKMEGDVCRPFTTITAAAAAVAEGGSIRIVPGMTPDRGSLGGSKKFTLVAPAGGVTIGSRGTAPAPSSEDQGALSDHDVWVQFDWYDSVGTRPPFLFNTVSEAIEAVAHNGVVHIEPGTTRERGIIGRGKRCVLVAPIGGVTIGARM